MLFWTLNLEFIVCFFRTLNHRLLRCFSEPWRLIVWFFWTLNLTHHVFVRTLNSKFIMCFFEPSTLNSSCIITCFLRTQIWVQGLKFKAFRVYISHCNLKTYSLRCAVRSVYDLGMLRSLRCRILRGLRYSVFSIRRSKKCWTNKQQADTGLFAAINYALSQWHKA